MKTKILDSFVKLKEYCEKEKFKGWDPYDGLNSEGVSRLAPVEAFCHLQTGDDSGVQEISLNLRPLAMVSKEYNAKGIGLFLSGYCNLYQVVAKHPEWSGRIGLKEEIKKQICFLADLLISLRSKGYSGSCWGYNFDWQARRLFLFPKFTPTVVATNFCATALMEAYEATGCKCYLDVALTAADFIIKDLHRSQYKEGFLFSYSPLKGNDTVFNASLLGPRLLSYCYHYTRNEEYKRLAELSVKACCAGQREDGAWVYGMLPVQSWVDSFHTGYNLDALIAYEEMTGDTKYHSFIEKGFDYYIRHFFEEDGTPKYYDNKMYPIDIHCPGQLLVTLHRLHQYGEHQDLVEKVMNWTLRNMQDKKGYFYYQLKPGISSKISYMRWSNAFMFHAMSCLLLEVM